MTEGNHQPTVPGIDEDRGPDLTGGRQALHDEHTYGQRADADSGGHDPTRRVGRGNPPRNRQFQPGQSGNISGRPKRDLTLVDVVTRALGKPVTVTEAGQRVEVSLTEAVIRSVAANTIKTGSPSGLRALHPYLSMASNFGQRDETDEETTDRLMREMTPEEWRLLRELGEEVGQYVDMPEAAEPPRSPDDTDPSKA